MHVTQTERSSAKDKRDVGQETEFTDHGNCQLKQKKQHAAETKQNNRISTS